MLLVGEGSLGCHGLDTPLVLLARAWHPEHSELQDAVLRAGAMASRAPCSARSAPCPRLSFPRRLGAEVPRSPAGARPGSGPRRLPHCPRQRGDVGRWEEAASPGPAWAAGSPSPSQRLPPEHQSGEKPRSCSRQRMRSCSHRRPENTAPLEPAGGTSQPGWAGPRSHPRGPISPGSFPCLHRALTHANEPG